MKKIWKRLPFLKNPRNEEELEALIDFSEELHEAIEGEMEHPLYSLYKVAETLILDYEKKHIPQPGSDPVGCLKFLMEQHDMRQVDLVKMGLGSQGVVSELLSGKREFNKRHIQILSK
ncbi:MAG: type II toxin-antitoxin system HigA family antitoxin, partial [Desulfococcaceae bacterium]